MKIKIVGFKVGQSRPTANRTIGDVSDYPCLDDEEYRAFVGQTVLHVLDKSDSISMWRVDE